MADEVTVSSKTLLLGDKVFQIVDDGADPLFVEVLTEHRHNNGVVYLSGGSIVLDGANEPEIHIKYRLRMSLVSAQILRDILSNIIDGAVSPPEKDKSH